jgi:hydrogenase nickel incorporation protein HypA/HybF
MHELSVACSIVEIVEKETKAYQNGKVTKVELDIGTLSGIEIEALVFSWDIAIKNSPISPAPLVINHITALAKCDECSHEFETKDYFTPCPKCGSIRTDIVKGKELQVKSITIDDD